MRKNIIIEQVLSREQTGISLFLQSLQFSRFASMNTFMSSVASDNFASTPFNDL